jgi:hypothetical protein
MGKAILSRRRSRLLILLNLQQLLWRRVRGGARVDRNWAGVALGVAAHLA